MEYWKETFANAQPINRWLAFKFLNIIYFSFLLQALILMFVRKNHQKTEFLILISITFANTTFWG